MGGPVTRVDGALRRAVADAAEGSAGQQRLGLMLYLAVTPASIAGSIVIGSSHGSLPIVARSAVLLGAIVLLARRPTLSRPEMYLLFAVLPAVLPLSAAWVFGARGDAPFYVAMMSVACIVAAVYDLGIVLALDALDVIGFTVVQFHVQSTSHALVSSAFVACAVPVSTGLIYSIAREQRRGRVELQTLVDQLPGSVFRFDVGRREMVYVSPYVEQLTGRPPEHWLGAEGYARWSSSMINPTTPDWEELGRAGVSWQNQYQWRRPDGELRWFRSITRIVEPHIVQSLVTDATDDVARAEALDYEQRRYQTLIEQMPAVTLRASADGVVEYVSPQVEEQFDLSSAELMQLLNSPDWLNVVHPEDRDRVAQFYARERTAGDQSSEIEMRVSGRGNAYRSMLVRRAKLDDREGAAYFHSVIIDITDLRAAEARSREALAALVRASEEEQARLAGELHDDTVQVLTAVLLQMQRVQPEHPVLADAAKMLEGAIERTRKLMFELRPEVLEREGLGAAMARVTRDGPWTRAEIDITVPRQSDTVEALCYRTLRELVVNSRKHSNAQNLRIGGREAGGRLELIVEDDGDGFDPLNALSGPDADLHVGLRTVVERVRLAGGDVDVTSSPGAGARVVVTLPAEPRFVGLRSA